MGKLLSRVKLSGEKARDALAGRALSNKMCVRSPGLLSRDLGRVGLFNLTVRFRHSGIGCVIHDGVVMQEMHHFQNLIIGAKWENWNTSSEEVPALDDRVMVEASAELIGPIQIGNDSFIVSNSVCTRNIPEDSTSTEVPVRIIEWQEMSVGSDIL